MPSKETKTAKESNYIITLRSEKCPAIAANIFRGSSSDGHIYLYFEISRSWKTGNREGYSQRYYSRNSEGIKEVADRAAIWIESNPQAVDGKLPPTTDGRIRITAPAPTQQQ